MRPYRTVLEQKIRERRQTFEEFAAYVEEFAREHNEPGTLSVRHLQRLVAGRRSDGRPLGTMQPATARLLERIFGLTVDELLASPSTSIATSDPEVALQQWLHRSRRVDDAVIMTLQDQLSGIRRIDRQLGSVLAHDEVLSKTTQVASLLTYSLSSGTRERLAALLSELHCLAGWQALDLARTTESWLHYSNAVAAAQQSGILPYLALAEAGRAFVLADIGETSDAVTVLGNVRRVADKKCSRLLRSWLAAAHGETLAADGQQTNSLRAFDRSAALLSIDATDATGPYVALDEVHLARWRGHALARCGNREAIQVLTSALSSLDPTFIRAETGLRVDLVTALSATDEHAEAISQADHANQLAIRIGSTRQQRRLKELAYES